MTASVTDLGLIAVTGATGFVGQAVLDAARRGACRCARWPGSRSGRAAGSNGSMAIWPIPTRSMRLMEGASAVIHIAGVVNAPDAAGFDEGNVGGHARTW